MTLNNYTNYYDWHESDAIVASEDEADGLIPKGTKRLVWEIEANVTNGYLNTQGDVVITEALPSAFSYDDVVIGFKHLYDDSYHYAEVTSSPTTLDVGNSKNTDITETEVTVQGQTSKNRFTITIPKELASAGYGEDKNGQNFKVEVYVKVNEPTKQVTEDGQTYIKEIYLNNVHLDLVTFNIQQKNQQIVLTNHNPNQRDPVQKYSGQTDLEIKDNNILYGIQINPEGLNLVEGSDTITIEDVLTYTLDDGEVFDIGLLERGGAAVTIHSAKDTNGNGVYDSDEAYVLSEDEYTLTYHVNEENGTYYRTISLLLKDETPYVINYTYHATGVTGATADINNTVRLVGSAGELYEKSVENHITVQASAAGATTDLNKIQLHKTDFDHQFTGLQGVKFDLYRQDRSNAIVSGITTGIGGYVDLLETTDVGKFKYNTLYYLVETQGLDGYESDSTKHYFYIKGEGDAPELPEGVTEDQVQVVIPGGTVQVNNKKYVDLTVHKVDAEDTSVELPGAKFSLYELGTTVKDTDDVQVGTQQTTDASAKAVFTGLSRDVVYKLVEDEAPDGYAKQEEPYYFYIKGEENAVIDYSKVPEAYREQVHVVDTMDYTLQFENGKSAKLELVKVNAKNSGQKLSGATFDLYKVDASGSAIPLVKDKKGIKIGTGTTGEDGTLSLDLDGDGEYYLVETSAPSGYITLTEAIPVSVDGGVVSLSNETDNTYTLGSSGGNYGATGINKQTVPWTFCINPTTRYSHPSNTSGYKLLENVSYQDVVDHIPADCMVANDTLTPDEYRKIQRALYWYLMEKDAYIAANKSGGASESRTYDIVERVIRAVIQNGTNPWKPTSATDPTGLYNLLFGNGTTTGLINGTQYDAAIDSTLTFDIFETSQAGYQNMITVRYGLPSVEQDGTVIQVGNTPQPGTPSTTSFTVSVKKAWEGVDEDKLPDDITLTLEQVVNDEVVGTTEIQLTKANNWVYTSTSFTATDNSGNAITYRIKEAGENGGKVVLGNNMYQVTYDTESVSGGVDITVTNKLIQNINQPETGANSRWLMLLGGVVLLLIAGAYFFLRNRGRK